MIFSTYWFLAAAALFLPVYWLVRHHRVRLAILLIFCFIFHAHFAGAAGVVPIIVLGLVTYTIGRTRNSAACLFGIALCVSALCLYKYTHFILAGLIGYFDPHLGAQADGIAKAILPETPPLAISFFAFEFEGLLISHSSRFTFLAWSLVRLSVIRSLFRHYIWACVKSS
jgi:hypothetical protein